jgi:hypothetical protein
MIAVKILFPDMEDMEKIANNRKKSLKQNYY